MATAEYRGVLVNYTTTEHYQARYLLLSVARSHPNAAKGRDGIQLYY